MCSEDNGGARAGQIRDHLLALDKPTDKHLSIYHDDRALFPRPLAEAYACGAGKGFRRANRGAWKLKRLMPSWVGEPQWIRRDTAWCASSMPAVNLLFEPVNQRLAKYDKAMRFSNEEAAWAMVSVRPANLLNPAYATYDDLLAKAVDLLLADLKGRGIALSQATWGSRNRLGIRHPLSRAVPQLSKWLGRWLDMPRCASLGDNHMPKVHGEGFGVSERMIVTPGHEETALEHARRAKRALPVTFLPKRDRLLAEGRTPALSCLDLRHTRLVLRPGG